MLQIKSIAMHLFDGMTREVALAHLVFENENQTAGNDDCVCPSAHPGYREFQEDMALGKVSADLLQMLYFNQPGALLRLFYRKIQTCREGAENCPGVEGCEG